MILYVTPQNKPLYYEQIEEMYALRHKIFKEKLKWDVKSSDGLEKDEFDHMDAYYILYLNKEKKVKGCMRLIPTTQKYMMQHTFPYLMQGSTYNTPDVWEVSRFAVDSHGEDSPAFRGINQITYQLYAALYEFGLTNNVQQYVFLASLSIERLLERIGCSPCRLSRIVPIGGIKSLVGSIKVDAETFIHLIYEGHLNPFFSLNKAKIEDTPLLHYSVKRQ